MKPPVYQRICVDSNWTTGAALPGLLRVLDGASTSESRRHWTMDSIKIIADFLVAQGCEIRMCIV